MGNAGLWVGIVSLILGASATLMGFSTDHHWLDRRVIPSVGNATIYVPGSGFSGFWYHHGLFQNSERLHDYSYYCYSSGCLSLLLAFANVTVDEAWNAGFEIQSLWKEGRLANRDIVRTFLKQTMPSSIENFGFLSRMNVLVTSSGGVETHRASTMDELVALMVKTTWIPFVTGDGLLFEGDSFYLDGGFSRHLHPKCEFSISVPSTWHTFVHSLNPGLSRDLVLKFWNMGKLDTISSRILSY